MTLTLETIPCLADNYAYLVHNDATGQTVLIDAPEAGPILAELHRRGWRLDELLITHHHGDHIDGVAALRETYGCRVTGAAADAHRLPPLDRQVADGDRIMVAGIETFVIAVPGHTLGHIAFHMPELGAAFTADSLMGLGCGRLFEGTAAQMWDSLCRLRALPPETLICSGHEYTASNARFAATIDPENPELKARALRIAALRAEDRPTVPVTLDEELRTNPFLRADNPAVQADLGMEGKPSVDVFAEIRRRKDNF